MRRTSPPPPPLPSPPKEKNPSHRRSPSPAADAADPALNSQRTEGSSRTSVRQISSLAVNAGDPSSNWRSTEGSSRTSMANDDESGTPEDQSAFMKELESFCREMALEFKPPKFYGQPLNLLK